MVHNSRAKATRKRKFPTTAPRAYCPDGGPKYNPVKLFPSLEVRSTSQESRFWRSDTRPAAAPAEGLAVATDMDEATEVTV